jgi:hypothetical protein
MTEIREWGMSTMWKPGGQIGLLAPEAIATTCLRLPTNLTRRRGA